MPHSDDCRKRQGIADRDSSFVLDAAGLPADEGVDGAAAGVTRDRDAIPRHDPTPSGDQHMGNGAGYEPAAVAPFLQVADYYLVAHAHAHYHVVVPHDVVSPSTKKIKIPNACLGMGVRYVTAFEMLRTQRARFVLGP